MDQVLNKLIQLVASQQSELLWHRRAIFFLIGFVFTQAFFLAVRT